MLTATNFSNDFASITSDQLDAVIGGFDWGQLARAAGGGALAGGAGGAAGGAAAGLLAGGVGAGPGALAGGVAGGVGGLVTGGINNAGQQLGWWK